MKPSQERKVISDINMLLAANEARDKKQGDDLWALMDVVASLQKRVENLEKAEKPVKKRSGK